MRDLLKYLKDYKKECVLAPLFKALEAGFELIVPILIARMIDAGIPHSDRQLIIRCGLMLLLLTVVGFASAVTAQYFAAKAAVGFSTKLRHDLFAKLLHFSFPQIDSVGAPAMITRMNSDVTNAQAGVNMFLRLFLRSPYIVIGATIMAFVIDPVSGLIFVALILVLSVAVVVIARTNISLLEAAQLRLERVTALIRENLSGVRVIRAFCRQKDQRASFDSANGELCLAQKKAGACSSLLNPVTYLIINLFILWLVRSGAISVTAGRLTTGAVVALYNYMSQILIELVKFANLLITMNKALAGGERIAAILKMEDVECVVFTEDTERDGAEENAFAVAFDHVSFRYHERADEVLSDIDFKIMPGETVGIIGGTGAGKTTLAHLISGFYRATKGTVSVNGRNVSEYDKKELTDLISIVMQKAVLFSGTIADNLRLGNREASDEELQEAVRLACCEEAVEEHGGLYASVEQGGTNFSGGQRQRLSIARALLKNAPILILDDASSALDYMTDKKLRSNLRSLKKSPTIFMISQRTTSLKDCDHILVLDDGCVAGYGTHNELLKTCTAYREIHLSQGREDDSEGGAA